MRETNICSGASVPEPGPDKEETWKAVGLLPTAGGAAEVPGV